MKKISEILQNARKHEAHALAKIEMVPKQRFHVCAPVGWINDPNGFSMFQGEYHLFYQYHPYSTVWGPMHWGHVKTTDFMTWEQLPTAIAPDMDYDANGCFSGSAIELNGEHVLFYTGVANKKEEDGTHTIRQTQCVAIGDGLNYEKNLQNPVILADTLPEGSSLEDFRDPKAWVDGAYIYLLVGSRSEDGSGQLPLYRSKDLVQWERISILDRSNNELGKMWECPDFFQLEDKHILIVSPQEVASKNLEFHNGNVTAALIGNLDKETYEFKRELVHAIDYGLDFYAPQTLETQDGRRIMIAWMQSWDNHMFPQEYGWSGTMTIPRELTLRNGRLVQLPISEIENYYTNTIAYENTKIEGATQFPDIKGRFFDMTVEISEGNYNEFIICLAHNEHFSTKISFDRKKNIITMDRRNSGVTKDMICIREMNRNHCRDVVTLRIVMDQYSVELFVDNGEQAASMLIFTPIEADQIQFIADGQATVSITKHEICTNHGMEK